jgi:hypothetical protein
MRWEVERGEADDYMTGQALNVDGGLVMGN